MATRTLIGLYETRDQAENAIKDLYAAGFDRDSVLLKKAEEITDTGEASGRETGFLAGVRDLLGDMGILGKGPSRPAWAGPGDMVVVVDTDDARVDKAADILNRHGAYDIEERMAQIRAGTTAKARPARTEAAAGQTLQSIEEELKVGKRTISRGGVRIFTRPTERTVDVPVTLREEEVHVERHPVDRPAGAEDIGAFREQSFEVRATGEEAVVGKEARVKEEVTVGKSAGERKETIRETVRGTKVEVQQLGAEHEKAFTGLESDFRRDWDANYARQGISYDEVLPIYRYGYQLGVDPFYGGDNWNQVEPKVRKDWDAHHYGNWNLYRHAVHSGWERAAHRH